MSIDLDRLKFVPQPFHQSHSFCFWLHDLMLDIMLQAEHARVSDVQLQFTGEEQEREALSYADPIIFCLDTGRIEIAKRITINRIIIPLYGDALHFIYEGLRALEKRKYAVAFALLRKPFRYTLMFASWLLGDEDDFFTRLRTDPAEEFDERKLKPEDRRAILSKAIAGLDFSDCFGADVILEMAFDKKNARGLAQYFDKAAHLVTSNVGMRTERLNLNFIFKDPNDTDVYENVYPLLAYLLAYLLFLELATIGRIAKVRETYKRWMILAVIGSYESLFGGELNMVNHVNETWRDILSCHLCGAQLEIGREDALALFATERVTCKACRTEQQFLLFWLMNRFSGGEPSK